MEQLLPKIVRSIEHKEAMNTYPKIRTVIPHRNYQLMVTFSNNMTKVYDCRSLLNQPAFSSLSDPAVFQTVQCDHGGYGVVWNDDLDVSESELWIHGQIIPDTTEQRNG